MGQNTNPQDLLRRLTTHIQSVIDSFPSPCREPMRALPAFARTWMHLAEPRPDPFPGLAPELRCMILQTLTPKDLQVALKASPELLASFQYDRRRTLQAVARNGIHPEAMDTALAVLYCPRFEDG